MKTKSTTHIIAVISALALGALNANEIKAEMTEGTNALIYNNRAYAHAIQNAPNPATERTVQNAEIIYVNKGYGQAIYSYPNNVANEHTAFNVEYVDTAYGQAIYSYPNNTVKHRLELVDNAVNLKNRLIVPVSLRTNSSPVSSAETIN